MPTCQHVVEQADDYLNGDMSPFRRWQYRLHLLICSRCRLFLHQFQLTIRTIGSLSTGDSPAPEAVDQLVNTLMTGTRGDPATRPVLTNDPKPEPPSDDAAP